MNKIIKILMEREDITRDEAKEMVAECRAALAGGDYNAISDYLGLEDDYIFDLI